MLVARDLYIGEKYADKFSDLVMLYFAIYREPYACSYYFGLQIVGKKSLRCVACVFGQ